MARASNRPVVAAALSMLVPGFGQFYAGSPGWGIAWLLITPGFWLGTGGCLGWLCHVVSALQAWDHASRPTA